MVSFGLRQALMSPRQDAVEPNEPAALSPMQWCWALALDGACNLDLILVRSMWRQSEAKTGPNGQP